VLPGGEQIPLFRLRYGGSAHSFGFAIYSPARDHYEDAVLLTGLPIGSPQEALDTACTVHLAGLGHEPEPWPPTNLRCHPLSLEVAPAPYALSSVLTCCDMTTSPDGELVLVENRLAEIHRRYGTGHPVSRSIQRATPTILGAVEQVHHRAARTA
jgi:hypothetical protein